MGRKTLTAEDDRRPLPVRSGLRHFLRWGDDQANDAGLAGAQHQHHIAIGLVDRADAAGPVVRYDDPDDGRVIRLRATPKGAKGRANLSALHLDELVRPAAEIQSIWQDLEGGR